MAFYCPTANKNKKVKVENEKNGTLRSIKCLLTTRASMVQKFKDKSQVIASPLFEGFV